MAMTITEALAEIKTIGKRLEKKREAVLANIGRDSRLKDPLADANGMTSTKYLAEERQAITDLEKRIVAIRTSIQKSNLTTACTVGTLTMPVQDWLNFRREISVGRQSFLMRMNQSIRNLRSQAQAKGGRVVMAGAVSQASVTTGDNPPVEFVLHLDEKNLLEEQENLEQTLGELDGKLSLLNATTVIDV
jgi:hypothetical protein